MKFRPAIVESESVGCVNDPDERVSLFKVVSPVTAECFLATHVPYSIIIIIINTFSSAGCLAAGGRSERKRRVEGMKTVHMLEHFSLSFTYICSA